MLMGANRDSLLNRAKRRLLCVTHHTHFPVMVRIATLALVFLTATSFHLPSTAASSRFQWSVDLNDYGLLYPHDYSSLTNLAASDDFVALVVYRPSDAQTRAVPGKNLLYRTSIFVFGTNRGKLAAVCGSWIGSGASGFWSTAKGNFLIRLERSAGIAKKGPESRLLLISHSCKPLKELEQWSHGPRSGWAVFLSPSRRTVLLQGPPRGDGVHIEIRDADTLALRGRWTEPPSASHEIIGVSDDALLGADPAKSGGFKPPRYIRSFDGQWHRLAVDHADAFLSANRLVGADAPFTNYLKTGKSTVVVSGIDGTPILSRVISGFQYTVFPLSGLAEASDGQHFGWVFDFAAAGWFWGNLDMGPEHQTLYVWSAPNPKPVAKIRLGRTFFPQFALPPDGKWVTWLDGHNLRSRPLHQR
jgi:hypothetical protein